MNTKDYWYTISKNTNLETLMDLIKNHIVRFVIPYFTYLNKDEDIIDLYNQKLCSKAPYDHAFLAGFIILYGNKDSGEQLLREHYSNITNDAYAETIRRYSNELGVIVEG